MQAPLPDISPPAWVTCAPSGDPAEAQRIARACGLRVVERPGTLRDLLAEANGLPVLVLGAADAILHHELEVERGGRRGEHEPPGFRLTPGMAQLRLQNAIKGDSDPLVRFAELVPGDRVVDLTLGLGGDALLAAHATQAKVIGVEAHPVLAACAMASLARAGHRNPKVAAVAARIEVVCADHATWLAQQPARSFEVALLDPMFRAPSAAAPAFDLVRRFALHEPLTPELLLSARRIVSRCVLVKDAAPGHELDRLGLQPISSRRMPKVVFGRAPAG